MECSICCNDLSSSDQRVPLLCPTPSCSFNMCVNCLESMQRSAKDDYQEASDGSKQVKVKLQCPQCRGNYQCSNYNSTVVVQAVLTVRKAHAMQGLLKQQDSNLSATALKQKDAFIRSTSLDELQSSLHRIEVYQNEIGKTSELVSLDWAIFKDIPPQRCQLWNDPTLFYGMEDLMNKDEQVFVTQLLTSGKSELLAQGAMIMQNMWTVTRKEETVIQELSTFSYTDLHKIRKRFPLPARMPRCVSLPTYNPESHRLLKFQSTSLALSGVKGVAGRSGLRQGDAITHLNGEEVVSQSEFNEALRQVQSSTIFVTVNADEETALGLNTRAKQMQLHNLKF